MHYSEIDPKATIQDASFDLDDLYGERPVLLTNFATLDSSDVIVPVDEDSPYGCILALTEEQGRQALLTLAEQLGYESAYDIIGKRLDKEGRKSERP